MGCSRPDNTSCQHSPSMSDPPASIDGSRVRARRKVFRNVALVASLIPMKHDLHASRGQAIIRRRIHLGNNSARRIGLPIEELRHQTLLGQPISWVEFLACFDNRPGHRHGGESLRRQAFHERTRCNTRFIMRVEIAHLRCERNARLAGLGFPVFRTPKILMFYHASRLLFR